MTENIEKMENKTNVDTEVNVERKKPDEVEKTYSQAEVDNIVKSRLARQNSKIKSLKAQNAELIEEAKDYKILSKIFDEKGDIKGNTKEQISKAAEFYGMSEDEVAKIMSDADVDSKSDKQTMAYFKAKMFVEQSDADEIQEEYDRISAIPEDKRSINDRELFKQIKPKVTEDLSEKIAADRKWLEEDVEGADFDKLIRSEEFVDFMNGTNFSVRKGLEKFIKLKGKDAIRESFAKDEIKEGPASTGSVKDSGASRLKEYYSPEDVDNLSDEDYNDPLIFERVRQSMTKWK